DLAGQFQPRRGREGDPPRRRRHQGATHPRLRYGARCGRGCGGRPCRGRRHHRRKRGAGTRCRQTAHNRHFLARSPGRALCLGAHLDRAGRRLRHRIVARRQRPTRARRRAGCILAERARRRRADAAMVRRPCPSLLDADVSRWRRVARLSRARTDGDEGDARRARPARWLKRGPQNWKRPMVAPEELGVSEAAAAIRIGALTAEALAEALLRQCAAAAPLNAFISLEPDRVRVAARRADQQRERGDRLRPLHGVPLVLKDNIDTADYPTTAGTPGLAAHRPKRDAPIVQRLLDAGALILGKANLQELAYGPTSNNAAFGPVRNPYDPTRIPGG